MLRPCALLVPVVCLLTAAVLPVAAIPHALVEALEGLSVELPDGSQAWILAPATGAPPDSPPPILTAERLATCLETIDEAGAWPVAWLVVQVREAEFDLVMRLVQDKAGEITEPEFVFTVPRRDWQFGDLKRIVPDATGRRAPRKGLDSLVVQGFSTRVVTQYVYSEPKEPAREGSLRALLPAGAMIREARALDLDGSRLTLALVLLDARFLPSNCRDCGASVFGHADSGTVLLVLTDETEVLSRLDLTPRLRGLDGTPLLPRHRCADATVDPPSAEQLQAADPIPLLNMVDLDDDGRQLEIELPAEQLDCDRHATLIAAILPEGPTLALLESSRTLPSH